MTKMEDFIGMIMRKLMHIASPMIMHQDPLELYLKMAMRTGGGDGIMFPQDKEE